MHSSDSLDADAGDFGVARNERDASAESVRSAPKDARRLMDRAGEIDKTIERLLSRGKLDEHVDVTADPSSITYH